MKAEQLERLQQLSDRIAEVVLVDADPDNWSGAGLLPKDMTKQERGDAYWCRKQAAATLSLLMRVEQMQTDWRTNAPRLPGEETGLDADIAVAEAKAAQLLDATLRRAGKQQFDAHVHGKKH